MSRPFVLLLLIISFAGCTSTATREGTRQVSMWDRNVGAGAIGRGSDRDISD